MRVCSLFSGIGGIDLGFIQAGFEIVWANEFDEDTARTYRYNFKDCNLVVKNIKKVNIDTIPDFDVLTAGFPCQPFSSAGMQKGFQDTRGTLFFEIVKVVERKRPKVIFLENVANLLGHDDGKTFNAIHNELASRDYYIRYIIADACDYGVPQHRTRTYIVAFKSKEACDRFRFPEKCKLEKRIFDIIDKNINADDSYYLDIDSYQYKKLCSSIKDDKQIYRFSDYGIQASKEGVSFTLKANMGTWRNRVPYIKDNFGIRRITPYECLALQGFPKDYHFPNIPMTSAYIQCGNSVVVPVIREIAKQIAIIIL